MTTIGNILRNSLRPGFAGEMIRKVGLRLSERRLAAARQDVERWNRERTVDADAWATALDPALWREAKDFGEAQQAYAEPVLREAGVPLGGGGFYPLLYFLTRLTRPEYIVESGVAAGFSSRAFLTALRENGRGRLFSSDFPYFRLENPERYVGILVEEDLRADWVLFTAGDRANFPKIMEQVPRVDLFHYDSDKSYAGRSFAWEQVRPKLGEEAVVLFDDIQDNPHFIHLARDTGWNVTVFEFGGKWIGMLMKANLATSRTAQKS